jgi:hypothetical protein
MFFSGFDPTSNEALVEAAGMSVVESRVEPMQEPKGEAPRSEVRVECGSFGSVRVAQALSREAREDRG